MNDALRQLLEAAREIRGTQHGKPSRHEYVEWAYGQAALENPDVTREIAETAVDALLASESK